MNKSMAAEMESIKTKLDATILNKFKSMGLVRHHTNPTTSTSLFFDKKGAFPPKLFQELISDLAFEKKFEKDEV